ncbi:sulfatase atsG [Rhodopirellula maiorica SM1]|uniref:Sulfatase atsG n=1 Tax=Rhodopirellula maiorica SM1 TaxID=1265738 RepID=M5RIB5_9BACT|nr:sulfatase atsG [Rhodopirellula maiorica SM1]
MILNLMPERAYCQFSFYKESAYPVLAEMNVLNLQGKLTPEQAAFMSSSKPPIELFDLRTDPHEVHNVADEEEYASVKTELLGELQRWRKEVVGDAGVTDAFRGDGVFPDTRPTNTVGQWIQDNADSYDFAAHGVPRWYPTRTLDEWQEVRDLWSPWVFREVDSSMKRPVIPFTKKPTK